MVWQRKKIGEMRPCVDLKMNINGKVMDEDYSIAVLETTFRNLYWASSFGKIDLSDAYYQIELDDEAKDNQHISGTVNDLPTTSGVEILFLNFPEWHQTNSERNQRCFDISRWTVDLWNYQGAVWKECMQSRLDYAIKSLLCMKNV